MNIQSAFGIVLLSLASGVAFAGVVPLPEPGVLELLAVAAIAAVAVAVRKGAK